MSNTTNATTQAKATQRAAAKPAAKASVRASSAAKNSAARGGSAAKPVAATAKAAPAPAVAKAAAKTVVKAVAAKAVMNSAVSGKAPVPERAPAPEKAPAVAATPAPKLEPVKKIAPAPQPGAMAATPFHAPSTPATTAAPAAAGKTSATTTVGEDKELAKRTELPVTTAAPVASDKTATDLKSGVKAPALPVKPKPASQKHGFKLNEFIVYPAHGVGQITGVEIQEVAGFSLELFVVSFIKDKMILKVPTSKVVNVGMRKLAETNVVEKALTTLSGRARVKRTMWSRRAQEYEAKINSGDLVTIAEVVRDLYRSDTQPEQSYSERQLYEAALDRMAREIAAVRKLIDFESLKLIESFLQKGPRRGQKTDAEAAEDGDEEDVDRAA